MRNFSCLIILLLFITLFACNKDNINIESIYVNIDKPNQFPGQVNIVDIVHLESSEDVIIGEISQIEYFKGKYYILDRTYSKRLFIFDSTGRFIRKSFIGKGPGEHNHIIYFEIDSVKEIINVWDEDRCTIFSYNLELDFIKENFSRVIIRSFKSINDSLIFAFVRSTDSPTKPDFYYNYFVYNKNFSKVFDRIGPIDPELSSLSLNNTISHYNNRLLFLCLYDPIIYEYTNSTVIPVYKIDFGKYNLKNYTIERGYQYIRNEYFNGKHIPYIDNILENSDYIIFSYGNFSRKMEPCIYSKENKEAYSLDKINLPIMEIRGRLPDNKLYGIVEPKEINEYYKRNNIANNKKALDIDNPIIVVIELKR